MKGIKPKGKLIRIGLGILLICVYLSGCFGFGENGQSSEEKKFIGTWKSENISQGHQLEIITNLDFFSDGTYTTNIVGMSGTYELKDGKLILSFNNQIMWSLNFIFSNNNQILTIIDINDKSAIYNKQ